MLGKNISLANNKGCFCHIATSLLAPFALNQSAFESDFENRSLLSLVQLVQ
jgi:hypothetical protein